MWVHSVVTLVLIVGLWALAHYSRLTFRSPLGQLLTVLLGLTAMLALAKLFARFEGDWLDVVWLLFKFSLAITIWVLYFVLSALRYGDVDKVLTPEAQEDL